MLELYVLSKQDQQKSCRLLLSKLIMGGGNDYSISWKYNSISYVRPNETSWGLSTERVFNFSLQGIGKV